MSNQKSPGRRQFRVVTQGGTEWYPKRDACHPAPLSYNGNQSEQVAVAAGHLPAKVAGNTSIPSREETEEDKKERKKQELE